MPEPMSDERLAEIRERLERTYDRATSDLLAEVERLRAERTEIRAALIRELRASHRFRKAWKSARRGRAKVRAELADLAAQNAKTESNFEEFAEVIIPERDRLEAERDAVREQMKRVRDIDVIRPAIADPGQFVKRHRERRDGEWIYESLPAWCARAVIRALDGTVSDA